MEAKLHACTIAAMTMFIRPAQDQASPDPSFYGEKFMKYDTYLRSYWPLATGRVGKVGLLPVCRSEEDAHVLVEGRVLVYK